MTSHNTDIVEALVAELYAADPSLRTHDRLVRAIVAQLVANRPDTHFDDGFRLKLRHELSARIDAMSSAKITNNFNIINLMNKFSLAFGAIGVIALVVAGSLYLYPQFLPGRLGQFVAFGSDVVVTAVGERAFGALGETARPQSGGGGFGLGGGGAAPATENISITADTKLAAPAGMGGGGVDMILPYFPNFKYVYTGDPLLDPEATQTVYRRIKGEMPSSSVAGVLNRLTLGLLDLSTFSNSKLQSFNLVQENQFGYSVYVNLQDGTMSISQNWPVWPQPGMGCQDQSCWESLRIKPEQVPSDERAIEIARAFLAEHKVPTENYGAPFVLDNWRLMYERAVDKSQIYIPEIVTVIFPVKIDGRIAYDEGGNPSGISVGIDVRNLRASGAWDINSQRYESSAYAAEIDTARLLKLAENGGYHGGYYAGDPNGPVQTVELGTPSVQLARIWNSKPGSYQTDELFVPALVFPVVKAPESEYFNRQNVIVPLVKEILDNDQSGPIRILDAPAVEPAVEVNN